MVWQLRYGVRACGLARHCEAHAAFDMLLYYIRLNTCSLGTQKTDSNITNITPSSMGQAISRHAHPCLARVCGLELWYHNFFFSHSPPPRRVCACLWRADEQKAPQVAGGSPSHVPWLKHAKPSSRRAESWR